MHVNFQSLETPAGTDDDLPPSHQNRFKQPDHAAGKGRLAVVGTGPFPRMQNDMEAQIHNIEQEAYASVLRAFKAQSDAITWVPVSLFNGPAFYELCWIGLTILVFVPMHFRKKKV